MIDVAIDEPGSIAVTFRLLQRIDAERIAVVGEFNGWDRDQTVMGLADNQWSATVALPAGRRYRFRYLIDGARWENDWEADDYVDNEFGGTDSVVDLTAHGMGRERRHHLDPRSLT